MTHNALPLGRNTARLSALWSLLRLIRPRRQPRSTSVATLSPHMTRDIGLQPDHATQARLARCLQSMSGGAGR